MNKPDITLKYVKGIWADQHGREVMNPEILDKDKTPAHFVWKGEYEVRDWVDRGFDNEPSKDYIFLKP